MGESLWLHERCLALQLLRDEPPPSHPSSLIPRRRSSRQLSLQHGRGAGGGGEGSIKNKPSSNAEAWCSSIITPTSPSTESETPTPTNAGGGTLPPLPTSTNNLALPQDSNHLDKYQDGYLLFQAWQDANTVCVWNTELVAAVKEAVYVGLLVGGILLIGGTSKVLATITHAWSRSLLVAPTCFTLNMVGEVSGCKMVAVPQGHFTPLADALCWVIHRLTEKGGSADPETVHNTLTSSFPNLNTPDPTIIHATLSGLIHQRKVFHSGSSYGIVNPNTYQLTPVNNLYSSPSHATVSPLSSHRVSCHAFPETREPKSYPGGAQLVTQDGVCHAIVQTNLAELITGATLPTDKIITPNLQAWGKHSSLERQSSVGMLSSRRYYSRTASLRLSPTKVAQLATAFGQVSSSTALCNTSVYEANDMTDITVKPERGSVLSKLLRVSPRRRLASFSAQFPPPEWNDARSPVIHLHSVAVQTSRQKKESNDLWWSSIPTWAPRSSTLPRRLHRPLSCTPPCSRSSNSATPPLMQASSIHVLGPESLHLSTHAVPLMVSQGNLLHYPSFPNQGSLDGLHSESFNFYPAKNHLSRDGCRRHSRSQQNVDEQRPGSVEYLDEVYTTPSTYNKMAMKKQDVNAAPEHHSCRKKSHSRSSKRVPTLQNRAPEEGTPKHLGEVYQKKVEEDAKGKDFMCLHQQKQKSHHNAKGKQYKVQETSCKHKSTEKDQKREKPSQENKIGELNDYDVTPVRDLPLFPLTVNKEDCSDPADIELTNHQEEKASSPNLSKRTKDNDDSVEEQAKKNCKLKPVQKVNDSGHYNRSSLQLDLKVLHMNNSKKVISSPHRPEGLKNNMLHDNKEMNDITKGSSHEVTNRNLGYRDVDKCLKQPCSQTLDEANQATDQNEQEQCTKSFQQQQQQQQQSSADQNALDESSKSKGKSHKSPKKKLVTSALKDPNIMTEDKTKVSSKSIDSVSPDESNLEKKRTSDAEVASINTYPSLSELNLNFTSLAAQKILHGVSHNSIDTLVEVNLAAQKHKIGGKCPDAVTNTDFGFL